MDTTTNLNLHKPAYTDDADIAILNQNFDIIDEGFGLLRHHVIPTISPAGPISVTVPNITSVADGLTLHLFFPDGWEGYGQATLTVNGGQPYGILLTGINLGDVNDGKIFNNGALVPFTFHAATQKWIAQGNSINQKYREIRGSTAWFDIQGYGSSGHGTVDYGGFVGEGGLEWDSKQPFIIASLEWALENVNNDTNVVLNVYNANLKNFSFCYKNVGSTNGIARVNWSARAAMWGSQDNWGNLIDPINP